MNEIALDSQWKWAARLGYAARGSIYLVIGALALASVFSAGGKTTDSKGAIVTILQQPFGQVLLAILVIGLISYSAWRLTQAITDVDDHGTGVKGLAIRGGLFVSAVTHFSLSIWTATLLFGGSSSSSGSSSLLGSTYGQIIGIVAGICIFGAGIAHLVKGWQAGFEKYMTIPQEQRFWLRPICRFGLISRGLVYCIIGGFVASSAYAAQAGNIEGVGDALSYLRSQPYGAWLLAIVSVGLFAFGIYSVLEAIYRRIDSPAD